MAYVDFLNMELPKPLGKEELILCFEKMSDGDKKAKDTIIMHNLRLITNYINSDFWGRNDKEDLFYVGVEGLIIAVNTFDITKKIAFSTYATKCIKNSIISFIKKENKEGKVLYLEQPIASDKEGEELSLLNIIPDESDVLEDIELIESLRLLREILDALSEEERNLIESHFKINGKDASLRDLVGICNLTSKAGVSVRIKSILKKLKKEYVKTDKYTGEKYLKIKK